MKIGFIFANFLGGEIKKWLAKKHQALQYTLKNFHQKFDHVKYYEMLLVRHHSLLLYTLLNTKQMAKANQIDLKQAFLNL